MIANISMEEGARNVEDEGERVGTQRSLEFIVATKSNSIEESDTQPKVAEFPR